MNWLSVTSTLYIYANKLWNYVGSVQSKTFQKAVSKLIIVPPTSHPGVREMSSMAMSLCMPEPTVPCTTICNTTNISIRIQSTTNLICIGNVIRVKRWDENKHSKYWPL